MKVFLGGTVNGSRWRDYLISRLEVDYFNPVVKEWTEKERLNELHERKTCEYLLYVLTPKMDGYYSIAEVTDDSYKRPDRTIFCYLEKDEGVVFSDDRKDDLRKLSRKVIENGAVFLSSLDDVAEFLNSANQRSKSIRKESDQMFDIFISYGRRHSAAFAQKLHDRLNSNGKKVWFDKNNIPLAVDFQEQIDEGIERSDNFIFIISPHSVKSEYCKKEIDLALKHGKRIIPILHIEPVDSWYLLAPEIAQLNWIYFRENEDFSTPLDNWTQIDAFEPAYNGLLSVLESHKEYVRFHTLLLHSALVWNKKFRDTHQLLAGKDRVDAEKWLTTKNFKNAQTGNLSQVPYKATELQAEYIVESKKNANNLLTEVFISFFKTSDKRRSDIIRQLNKFCISTWSHERDISKGSDFQKSTNLGLIRADNYLYFIRKKEIEDKNVVAELRLAKRFNKRIIPILLENISQEERNKLPWFVKNMSFIDFTDAFKSNEESNINIQNLEEQQKLNKRNELVFSKSLFERRVEELIAVLGRDADFYSKHKYLLNQAIKWKEQNQNSSILLRGHNLENAIKWLKVAEIKEHKPVLEQVEFISESQAKLGLLNTDVFISYSRKNADFARRVNEYLQLSGKTTWFDQESIASASDFQGEIYSGIKNSDNFLFIVSPEAVKSPYCDDEVSVAVKHNKRIITVLQTETEIKDMPQVLRRIQWLDFTVRSFSDSFAELLRTIDLDREYVRLHTKYAQLASEWIEKNKVKELLIRGNELIFAHDWLKLAESKIDDDLTRLYSRPNPTKFQSEFIRDSFDESESIKKREDEHQQRLLFLEQEGRKSADEKVEVQKKAAKKQRFLLIFLSLALVFTLIAGVEAFRQSGIAEDKAEQANILLADVEEQKILLNISKLKLELALASIDSLQKMQNEALSKVNTVEEAQKIMKKYKSEIDVKKQESESVLLSSEDELVKSGKSFIIGKIKKQKAIAVTMNVVELKDAVELLSKQLNGFMSDKQRAETLASIIAFYDALAVKEQKLSYRVKESIAYDNLIIQRKEIFDKINLTKEVIKIRENIFSKNPNNSLVYSKLSVNYGNLAWYYLLVKKYDEARLSATRGFEIDHSQFWIKIYLANSLLLLDRPDEAMVLYAKYRDARHFLGHSFKQEYVKQIATLRSFGINSPYFEKVLDLAR